VYGLGPLSVEHVGQKGFVCRGVLPDAVALRGATLPIPAEMGRNNRGIWNSENLDLTQLVADKAYEFLFVRALLKLKGATGSPGNPVALY